MLGTEKKWSDECVHFLQWALPRLNLRWDGFRKVRGQVCKRLKKRLMELGLGSLADYRQYLLGEQAEWDQLDVMCRITISRFYRDKGVFDQLRSCIFPDLLSKSTRLHIWCIGCASGEEPYTLSLIFNLAKEIPKSSRWSILATDVNAQLIERARQGVYPAGCLRELPGDWIQRAFEKEEKSYRLKDSLKNDIDFRIHDIRSDMPQGRFDLIFCRNLVFTYFNNLLQEQLGRRITSKIRDPGYLIVGSHESLPDRLNTSFSLISPSIYLKL